VTKVRIFAKKAFMVGVLSELFGGRKTISQPSDDWRRLADEQNDKLNYTKRTPVGAPQPNNPLTLSEV
jgi:hypothetical protein